MLLIFPKTTLFHISAHRSIHNIVRLLKIPSIRMGFFRFVILLHKLRLFQQYKLCDMDLYRMPAQECHRR